MRDFFFQIVLFISGAIIGIAVPLLKPVYQKWIAGILSVLLIAVSLIWFGYELDTNPTSSNSVADKETNMPSPTQPTSQPATDSNLLLNEDFEDGRADGITVTSGKWYVIDDGTGNKVFEASNLGDFSLWPSVDLGPTTLGDYTIEYRVKLIEYDISAETGSGMAFVQFRMDGEGYLYVFAFTPYWHTFEASYQKPNTRWENIEGAKGIGRYDFQKNIWYSVRVDARGKQITVYLDGARVFAVEDTRLQQGGLALNTGPNTIAQFDDVRVSK